jgi:acyl carrier protein
LLSLWRGLLGRDGIGPDDNFFELGGHSLLVVQMIGAIEKDFAARLAPVDIFQYPTVRGLAQRIAQQGDGAAPAYQQLFPIQPVGRRPPFIMASPAFFVQALSERFRGERPVYGVRGVSLRAEGNRGRWPTLTHLASEVADEICRRFPDPPYIVAGYSFGAWLAAETTRVLEERNRQVLKLIMIAPMPVDFFRAGPFRIRIDGLTQPLAELGAGEAVRRWLRSMSPVSRRPYRRGRQWLVERPWRRTLSLVGALRRRRGLPLTPRLMLADAQVERFRLHAGHEFAPVRTPVEFFNPVGPASDSAATWRPYFAGPLRVHPIPDPHDDTTVAAARDAVLAHLHDVGDDARR